MNQELLNLFNKQINLEFYTSYLYYAMSTYFDKIVMQGFSMYMKHKASCELSVAQKIYDYLILREEKLSFLKIEGLTPHWTDISNVFSCALEHEKMLLDEIQKLSLSAKKHYDKGAIDFISEIYEQKNNSVKNWREIISKIQNPKIIQLENNAVDIYI